MGVVIPLNLALKIDKDFVNLILDSGAKIDDKTMRIATRDGILDLPLFRRLVKNGGKIDNELLFNIVRNQHIESYDKIAILQIMLESGLSANAKDDMGESLLETLLKMAYFDKDFDSDIFLLLSKHGADINAINSDNKSVLDIFYRLYDNDREGF